MMRHPKKLDVIHRIRRTAERQRRDDISSADRGGDGVFGGFQAGAWCKASGTSPWADWDGSHWSSDEVFFPFSYELANSGAYTVDPDGAGIDKLVIETSGWYVSLFIGRMFLNGALGGAYVRQQLEVGDTGAPDFNPIGGPVDGLAGASHKVQNFDVTNDLDSVVTIACMGPVVAGSRIYIDVFTAVDDESAMSIDRPRFMIARLGDLPGGYDPTAVAHWFKSF